MTTISNKKQVSRLRTTLIVSTVFIAAAVLASCLAQFIVHDSPLSMNAALRLKPPNQDHLLGTDMYGRDIFGRILYGGKTSLLIGVATALLATVIGTFLGLIASTGHYSDKVLMRVMDGMMAIPGILLAIALATIFGGGILTVIFAMAVPEVPIVARLVRGLSLTIRQQLFVEAARTYNAGRFRLLARYILPNALAPIAVQATYTCGVAILAEAYLSFVGVGIPPEQPSWGNIVADARSFALIAPHLIIYPSILIALVVLAINLIGDSVRDMLDPRFSLP